MTTPRTLTLVTRLRALHPEFKPEWWRHGAAVPCCTACHSSKGVERIDLGYGDFRYACEACGAAIYDDGDTYDQKIAFDPPRYIGPPDLLARGCLADLFDVCRKLLSEEGILRTSFCDGLNRVEIETVQDDKWASFVGRNKSSQSEALMLAAEAALAAGEDVAGG